MPSSRDVPLGSAILSSDISRLKTPYDSFPKLRFDNKVPMSHNYLPVESKRQTNIGLTAPTDFDGQILAAQALGVSSATRLIGKLAKPGSTEPR
jgi:hypothetical protein